MSEKVLYLFPDTNVFLQCKPLENVSWASFGVFDRIEVLLTRPVQAEIDGLKGKGNGRQASKARTVSSRIRELLQAEGGRITLRESPLVQLMLRHDLRRDDSAAGDLDYDERDDQLVGTALAFQRAHPTEAIWLLTHDTGPMASARAVNLPFREVPQEWLLAPEPDESDRQLTALRAELTRYKSAEPVFEVTAQPPMQKLRAQVTNYAELSGEELSTLMARLIARFPEATEFGPPKRQVRVPAPGALARVTIFDSTEVFEPASEEEVAAYSKDYANWKDECREKLLRLPEVLSNASWPNLRIQIANGGTRPANSALAIFSVQGKLRLMPSGDAADENMDDGDAEEGAGADSVSTLRAAPLPPQGSWKRTSAYRVVGDVARLISVSQIPRDYADLLRMPKGFVRDPNEVYFKVGSRGKPSEHVEYECEEWRHARAPEEFEFSVLCPREAGTHAGLLTVEVHATNLTKPAELKLPIEVQVTEVSCFDAAAMMVDALRT